MVQLTFANIPDQSNIKPVPGRGLSQDADPSDRKRWLDAIRPDCICTSRYSNKFIAESGLLPVRITRMPPRWKLPYKTVGMIELAPTFQMLKDAKLPGGAKVFDEAFDELLKRLDPRAVVANLRTMQHEHGCTGVVLLCYEDLRKPGERCHRKQVANWLKEKLGIQVEELPE